MSMRTMLASGDAAGQDGARLPAVAAFRLSPGSVENGIYCFFANRVHSMTEPTLRKPTKKAFFFPTSEASATTPAEREAKPAAKAPKRAAEATRSKHEKTKAKVAEVVKKVVEAEAEAEAEVVEAAPKGKGKRTKKESLKKESAKKDSPKKEKVVRDSFTMPRADYEKIATLKKKCLDAGVQVKKSELLRAALQLLDSTSEKRLLAAIAAVETVKTGRPSKSV